MIRHDGGLMNPTEYLIAFCRYVTGPAHGEQPADENANPGRQPVRLA
jgi:hypothetical protein